MVDTLNSSTPWMRVVAAAQRVYQPQPCLDGTTPCWTCGTVIDCMIEDWLEVGGRGFHPACADVWNESEQLLARRGVVR